VKKEVNRAGAQIIRTLAKLLMKNIEKIPFTDLYLVYPVLQSKDCPKTLPHLIKNCILNSPDKMKELVNSAVSSVETLLLLGEDKSSRIVRDIIEWIKQQQLEDGGWHWRPKQKLPKGAESEVWITLAVHNLLTRTEGADQTYLRRVRNYLCYSLEKMPENLRGWSRLAHVRTALLMLKDPKFEPSAKIKAKKFLQKTIEEIRFQQLPNGGWAGSEKTMQGGIFQTAMVLDALIQAGLDLKDNSVEKGFVFMIQRMDKLLRAKWSGVLLQALFIFANILVELQLTD